MKFNVAALLITFVCGLFFGGSAQARDTRGVYKYETALATATAKEKLGTDIKFYFGKQKHPEAAQDFGDFTSNKKTNAFNKSDLEACEWVFLSAMLSLRDRARKLGANAVVNIRSNYKGTLRDSDVEFECGAGALMAGVTLIGKVIKTK